MRIPLSRRGTFFSPWVLRFLVLTLLSAPVGAQETSAASGREVDEALRNFDLGGGATRVDNLVLRRDRAEMTFTGVFYFQAPVAGAVRGAVFLGQGTFRAEAPPSTFERQNLQRFLKSDVVESDFETAVLRFSDDTYEMIGGDRSTQAVSSKAAELAAEFEERFLKETGANVAARLAVSILNRENPGLFLAQFDKGKRGRFTFVLDYQSRIPAANFEINGGEKGLIFAYRGWTYSRDVWVAFYSLEDYERGRVEYSDVFDLVKSPHYTMQVDLQEPKRALKLAVRIDLEVTTGYLQALPFRINEDLGESTKERLKKAMRLKAARMEDGTALDAVQEDWEGGLTLFLPEAKTRGEKFAVELELEGDFLYDTVTFSGGHYPLSNATWYPRHGYLNRSTFDMTFHHHKNRRVTAMGNRVAEEPDPNDEDAMVTRYVMDRPVALVTFALAPFERHTEELKWDDGGSLQVEFDSLPGIEVIIKEDFILAELSNCLRYFSNIYGKYPYSTFGATYHPFGFGQGFPTMLLIPNTDRAHKHTYVFIAHETAHQWWGNIVAWRSYRDQWLSEGFAEYSGILYTGLRDKWSSEKDLIKELRHSLKETPGSETGIGTGRLVDVGPIILGHRLSTRKTLGAYQTLIYNKGALVLRMLHFLFTDPDTGSGQAFSDMMSDFVRRYKDREASTEDFIKVASEHFVKTPLGKRYRAQHLGWFFDQYVYRTNLPSYDLVYTLENQPDGSVILQGTLEQEHVTDKWLMAIPLEIEFRDGKHAHVVLAALGPHTPVRLKLPSRPKDVDLDPDMWVLSDKTRTHKK